MNSFENNLLFSHEMFLKAVESIANQVKNSGINYAFICPIPRGGYFLGSWLSHRLDIPMADIAENTELGFWMGNILFTEDVVDTGKTLEKWYNHFIFPKDDVATLVYKPMSTIKPKYYGITTEAWVTFPWENNKIESRDNGPEAI